MNTTYNILIDGMTDTIHCINVTEEVAWAMIKAKYETLNQEEVWIYLEESYGVSSINLLRRSGYYFAISDNGLVIENLSIVKNRFDRCIKGIKEG
jgi:hypothetical protein